MTDTFETQQSIILEPSQYTIQVEVNGEWLNLLDSVTDEDVAEWQRNGWIVDPDNMTAYKRIPNLSGDNAVDYQHVWLLQWKARATKDNGGAVEEPPF